MTERDYWPKLRKIYEEAGYFCLRLPDYGYRNNNSCPFDLLVARGGECAAIEMKIDEKPLKDRQEKALLRFEACGNLSLIVRVYPSTKIALAFDLRNGRNPEHSFLSQKIFD